MSKLKLSGKKTGNIIFGNLRIETNKVCNFFFKKRDLNVARMMKKSPNLVTFAVKLTKNHYFHFVKSY